MSVNIKKTGIFSAGGTGIGENLILNGDASGGFTNQHSSPSWWQAWHRYASEAGTDYSIVSINGKKWLHFKSYVGDPTSYTGFSQSSNGTGGTGSVIKPNTNYTISATWFSSEETKGCYWLHMRSSEGGANILQFVKSFNIGPTLQKIIYTFNSGSNNDYTINRFGFMIGAYYPITSTDIYITEIKMEEGTIATPYIPNINDVFFTSNKNSFIEVAHLKDSISLGRDYAITNNFYEI